MISPGISLLKYALAIAIIILLPASVVAQEANQYVGARLTSGRLVSIAILIVGIIGLVIGYRSKKRSANPLQANNAKKGAITGLILGLLCIVLSAIRLANTGDFGTGGGKAGSMVALLVGSIAVVLAVIPLYQYQKKKSN